MTINCPSRKKTERRLFTDANEPGTDLLSSACYQVRYCSIMVSWSSTPRLSVVSISTLLVVTLFMICKEDRSSELLIHSEVAHSSSSRSVNFGQDQPELADLVNSPLEFATGLAKEKIDNMLSLDDPGDINLRGKPSAQTKIKCTSLACGEAGWENDYALESERKLRDNHVGSDAEPDMSLGSVVSELQAKLESMKQKFRLIRAR